MGGFVPTPEQYRMWMASRKPVEPSAPDESFPRKAGRVFRAGVDTAGNLAAGEVQRLTDPVRKSAALVGEAAQEFSQGYSNEADEPDYIGDYIKRNPGQSAQLMKGITTPYEPEGQPEQATTNITAPAATAEMLRRKSQEEQSRTIRRMPDGSYTNQGSGGEVVMRNGESVGPDIGAPGRGGVSQPTEVGNPMDDPNYRNMAINQRGPQAVAEESQAEYQRKLYEILQRNPFAREAIMAQIQGQQQQSAIDRTYGQERAKQSAKLQALQQLDAEEQELRSEIDSTATPEQKAIALERLAEWRARQEVALGLRDRMDSAI